MIFVSHNICLSPVSEDDAASVVECMRDKEISYNTARIPYPYSMEDARIWLEDSIVFFEENGFYRNYAIRNESQHMIGAIGFHFNNGVESKDSEIGYWLGKSYWNRGIMTRVLRKFCEIAEKQYRMEILTAGVFIFNTASQRLLLGAGFRHTETTTGKIKKDGVKIDIMKFEKRLYPGLVT
jgi:RimJ/RimL family protein N-acetyltransferase